MNQLMEDDGTMIELHDGLFCLAMVIENDGLFGDGGG